MSSNKELMQRRSQAIPRGVGQIHPSFADRAENCRVWDVEGRESLDFAGGIAVLNSEGSKYGIEDYLEIKYMCIGL